MSASVNGGCIRVMSEPGLSDGASAIQLARCAESLGNSPEASVVLLPTCVRLGPMIPGETPWIVWQPRQALRANTALPRSARVPGAGLDGPASCTVAQRPNPESESTTTRSRMLAGDSPQNSAHRPEESPIEAERKAT